MSIVLIVSIAFLILSLGLFIHGFITTSETVVAGFFLGIMTVFFGFFVFCPMLVVETSIQKITDYDLSFNRDGAYVVLSNGYKTLVENFGEVEYLKSQPEEIELEVGYNSYGGVISRQIKFPE